MHFFQKHLYGISKKLSDYKKCDKSLTDYEKTEDYNAARIFIFYFLDDLPVPLPLFFLEGECLG